MDDLIQTRLSHRSRAMKNGKLVHDLQVPHRVCWRFPNDCDHPYCHEGMVPNQDPMALMKAAHDRGWRVTSARSEIGGKTMVEIDAHDEALDITNVHAKTLEAALIGAMHEATVDIADNLVECGCSEQSEGFKQARHEQDGADCEDTNYLVCLMHWCRECRTKTATVVVRYGPLLLHNCYDCGQSKETLDG